MNKRCNAVQRLLVFSMLTMLPMCQSAWANDYKQYGQAALTYPERAGILSHQFFNLSGTTINVIDDNQPSPNLAAWSGQAQGFGWGGPKDPSGKRYPGFFNDPPLTKSGDATEWLYWDIFWNYGPSCCVVQPDSFPLETGQPSSKGTYGALSKWPDPPNGTFPSTYGWASYSTAITPSLSPNTVLNYGAIADTWTITISNSALQIALAHVATAANALSSGVVEQTDFAWPYEDTQSNTTQYTNDTFNPVVGSNYGDNVYSSCGTEGAFPGITYENDNPCGVGFTAGPGTPNSQSQAYNWNPQQDSNASPPGQGGLWSGVHYAEVTSSGQTNLSSLPAVYTVNMAMLPINFSNYLDATEEIWLPNENAPPRWYTKAFGAHFTTAIGDPFLVSSYGSKILWFLVINQPLNIDTEVTDLQLALLNPTSDSELTLPIFNSGAVEYTYVKWLLGAQALGDEANYPGAASLAGGGLRYAFCAASETTTKKDGFWSYLFTKLADQAIKSALAGLATLPGGDIAVPILEASGGSNYAIDHVNAAISAAFTTDLTQPPALAANAPIVVNPTYSAGNQLGLLLTNYAVQEAVNNQLLFNYCDGSSISPTPDIISPLFANYNINTLYQSNTTDPTGGCYEPNVSDNAITATTCYASDGTPVATGSNPSGYTNVNGSDAVTMSIWNAYLTGSDIKTDDNGYITLGQPFGDTSAYSPPVQMLNANLYDPTTYSSPAPTTALPDSLKVQTTFNLNTGILTAQSYSVALAPGVETGTAPSATPQTSVTVSGPNPYVVSYSLPPQGDPGAPTYTGGSYTVSHYNATIANPITSTSTSTLFEVANGPQEIRMMGCPDNAGIEVKFTPDPVAPDGDGASVALSCLKTVTLDVQGVSLDYRNCVADQWASGGVFAAVTTSPDDNGDNGEVVLACACVPYYVAGVDSGYDYYDNNPITSQTLVTGYTGNTNNNSTFTLVGATSDLPNQPCPKPQGY